VAGSTAPPSVSASSSTTPPATRRERTARALRSRSTWIWLLAVVAVLPLPWHQLQLKGDVLVDLHVYREAGVSLLHHRPVYAQYVNTQYSLLPFTYPPPAAVLAVPLALLPLRVDGAIWFVAILLLLAWIARLLFTTAAREVGLRFPRLEPFLVPASFIGMTYLLPIHEQFRFGQVGVFLLALVLADLLTPKTGRFRGVLVGVATAIKLTPGVYVIGLALARRWRDAAMVLVGFLGVVALSWAAAPATSKAYWTDELFHSDRLGNNAGPANQSLRGALLRTRLDGLPGTAVLAAAIVVVGVAGFWVSTRAWKRGDELLAVTVVGLLSCLLSPVAWTHHYVYVLPLLALLVRDRHYVWTAVMAYVWSFNWPAHYNFHVGEGGVVGALWQVVSDEFAICAVIVVLAYAVREWRVAHRAAAPAPAVGAALRVPART
jgi:alpha-1,2-mannosyltransferase